MLLLAMACAVGGGDTSVGLGDDTGVTLPRPSADDCAVSPTWDGAVYGLLLTHCAGCHAATSPERYGAPDGVTFDTETQARGWAARVHLRVVEREDMPPAGGLTVDELTGLGLWLGCP